VGVDVLVAYELIPECLDDGKINWDAVVEKLTGSEFNTSLAELQVVATVRLTMLRNDIINQ
jgi:hypothetical protein